jgi:hypothetical protein
MATRHKYPVLATKKWSYGAELELADWPRGGKLLSGMAIDEAEWNNVNSNGVAVDGAGKLYNLGGEILTAPSTDPHAPADQLSWVKSQWPEARCNFRTGLNIHVRVPGLRDDLKRLKQLQAFIHESMPCLLLVIDPLSVPNKKAFPDQMAWKGARRDYLRCRKNHHTLLPPWRLALQMKARSPEEFFAAEAIHLPTGKVYWATVPRACVNLRQLLQTDTVEFRHFAGSSSPEEVLRATLWCKAFLEAGFEGGSARELLMNFGPRKGVAWPQAAPYIYWMDKGFFFTSRHFHPPETVRANIRVWLLRQRRES